MKEFNVGNKLMERNGEPDLKVERKEEIS